MRKIFSLFLGFIMLAGAVMGLFAVIVAPFEMIQKSKAENWPSRKGVITLSYAKYERGRKDDPPVWETQICGNYVVGGERFCISRVRYGDFRWGTGKARADETIAKYPVGREVEVFYSPDNPRLTLLEARSSWNELIILFGSGITGLILPVLVSVMLKKYK